MNGAVFGKCSASMFPTPTFLAPALFQPWNIPTMEKSAQGGVIVWHTPSYTVLEYDQNKQVWHPGTPEYLFLTFFAYPTCNDTVLEYDQNKQVWHPGTPEYLFLTFFAYPTCNEHTIWTCYT